MPRAPQRCSAAIRAARLVLGLLAQSRSIPSFITWIHSRGCEQAAKRNAACVEGARLPCWVNLHLQTRPSLWLSGPISHAGLRQPGLNTGNAARLLLSALLFLSMFNYFNEVHCVPPGTPSLSPAHTQALKYLSKCPSTEEV